MSLSARVASLLGIFLVSACSPSQPDSIGSDGSDDGASDGSTVAQPDARADAAATAVASAQNADAADTGADAADTGADATDIGADAATDAGVDVGTAVGTDAGKDVGADAQAAPYHPCPPAGAACAIMPLGDSITWGYGSSTGGGYRLRLLHDLWAAHHDATFVGVGSSGPDQLDGKPFPKKNEGYSGYTIDPAPAVMRAGISPLVAAALQTYAPHIVTLMIGTNDLGTNNDVRNAPARLASLIDAITTKSPRALLVVAQITPTGDDKLNALIQTFNAAIPALVKSRAAAGKHILLVDMYAAFTAHAAYKTDLLNDTLHPNDAGYDVMGDVWYAALAPHLPTNAP